MRIKLKNVIKDHLLLIFFLSFYFFALGFKLISHPTPFYDWDESINVQVSKETIENKSLVPLWQGNYWLDKPPFPFLFFGIIMKLTPFIQPEISLRLISLFLSIIALIFIYIIYLKAVNVTSEVKEERSDGKTSEVGKVMAFLTVVIIAFTPIFLQRSQILNLDVFLLIGWLGYLLFFQNFWLSLVFLTIAVLTKSLIGFYPILITLSYQTFTTLLSFRAKRSEVEKSLFKRTLVKIFSQMAILSIWYLVMFFFFGKDFWQQHIIETHFRRVTASIESHFGQRTYYIDLMIQQLGIFFWISLLGLVFVIYNALSVISTLSISKGRNLAKRKNYVWILYSLFLFPWFIFLNLTKTKIFWYLYPAIPQLAFLSVYPLTLLSHPLPFVSFPRKWESSSLLNRFRIKYGMTIIGIIILSYIFYQNFVKTNLFTTFYSKPEDHYRLALFAKDRCNSLSILVGKETRDATKTLEKLGLTITSTKQWGDHPSIVYYFGKKVDFYYDKTLLAKNLTSISKNNCLAIQTNDLDLNPENKQFNLVKNFNSIYLFKR